VSRKRTVVRYRFPLIFIPRRQPNMLAFAASPVTPTEYFPCVIATHPYWFYLISLFFNQELIDTKIRSDLFLHRRWPKLIFMKNLDKKSANY
jgi:hypothetical protein